MDPKEPCPPGLLQYSAVFPVLSCLNLHNAHKQNARESSPTVPWTQPYSDSWTPGWNCLGGRSRWRAVLNRWTESTPTAIHGSTGKCSTGFPAFGSSATTGWASTTSTWRTPRARGIPVGNTPGILNGATADMGMALMLASARLVVRGDRYARSAQFTHYEPARMLGREVHGTTLGIIGMGAIGTEVARRARAFEMTVLYHNRHRRAEAESETGAEYRSLDALLAESDYVIVCCPLTEETHHLINAGALMKMKATATLVNIARGAVVDTQALHEALTTGVIAAAALDVTDPEPLPREHPILALENLTIVPHLGSATVETRREMSRLSVENLFLGLDGRPPAASSSRPGHAVRRAPISGPKAWAGGKLARRRAIAG